MPIYTYRCENCGVQFERQQSFSDETLKRCPECNKNKLRRVITPSGIVFKGSGWYVTDSKSRSATASTPSPVKSEAKGEAKTESKSEHKDSATSGPTPSSGSGGSSGSGKSESGSSKSGSSE